MSSSPRMYLRQLFLLTLVSYGIYLLVNGSEAILNEERAMAGIFACDHQNCEAEAGRTMIRCDGLDNATTCNADATCVRSSCGRPLFNCMGVSYAGLSYPFDPDATTSTGLLDDTVARIFSHVYLCVGSVFQLLFPGIRQLILLTPMCCDGVLILHQ
jgi:hypothetical protein